MRQWVYIQAPRHVKENANEYAAIYVLAAGAWHARSLHLAAGAEGELIAARACTTTLDLTNLWGKHPNVQHENIRLRLCGIH